MSANPNRLQKNLPCLVILALYILCIFAANPIGEFPLNDDWSYTRSAFALGSGDGLKVDPWVAPSLVGQALYGGLLTKLFSPAFLVLRISTLLLSCCTLALLWGTLLRMGFGRIPASVMLLSWAFNPLQFSLSFTFMTEIPFIFFIAVALYLYVLHLDTGKAWLLVLSAGAIGYAFLIRQTALLLILALVCSILLDAQKSKRRRVRHAALTGLAAGIFIAGYYLWVVWNLVGTTPAVQRKFELLSHLRSRQIIGNSYGMLFYLAFMLAPVLIYAIPTALRALRGFGRNVRTCVPAAWCAIVVAGIAWFRAQYLPSEYLPSVSYHARMPFLLNVLYDSGLGPVTLDPDYFSPAPTPTHPAIWSAVSGIVAVLAVFAGALCTFALLRRRVPPAFQKWRQVTAFIALSFLLLAIFDVLFSHLQEGGLFDRHILIISFIFSMLIGLMSQEDHVAGKDTARRSLRLVAASSAIIVLGAFSVAATHDYMQWNRIRWEFGKGLLKKGVDPLSIVGGFEFNAWNNYDTFVARGFVAQTNHWWYDRRAYIITMTPLEGYEIRQSRAYFSWLNRRHINVYLIANSG